jgi:hypothetical protein
MQVPERQAGEWAGGEKAMPIWMGYGLVRVGFVVTCKRDFH